jgi:hypothetical protein
LVTVNAARSDPPTPRARAAGHAAQQREQEWAARAKEKRIRRRERLEQHNEEYRATGSASSKGFPFVGADELVIERGGGE